MSYFQGFQYSDSESAGYQPGYFSRQEDAADSMNQRQYHQHQYYATTESEAQCIDQRYAQASPSLSAPYDPYAAYASYYAGQDAAVSSARGVASYPYTQQPPVASVPAAPPEPYHQAKQSGRGYGSAMSSDIPLPATVDYSQVQPQPLHYYHPTQGELPHTHTHFEAQYTPQSNIHPIATNVAPAPSFTSPLRSYASASSSSTLANALGSPSVVPRTELRDHGSESGSVASGTPDPTEYNSPGPEEIGYTFIVESGPPRLRAGNAGEGSSSAAPTGPPRKKRAPPKGPRKEQGFLACYFCRGRKIACNAPPPGSGSTACEQCEKRHLVCEFPTESRRGQRGLGGSGRKGTTVSRRERSEAHRAMMQVQVPAPVSDSPDHDHDLEPGHEHEHAHSH